MAPEWKEAAGARVTALTELAGDSLLLTRMIRAVSTCGARTLSGLLHQFLSDAPGMRPDTSKGGVPVPLEAAVALVDDPGGQPLSADPNQTVRFALDGQRYEIDLSDQDAAAFRLALQPYVQSGRRASRRTGTSASARRSTPDRRGTAGRRREDNALIREWARAQGHEVSDRGRIPRMVLEAYQASG
ncbi:MAG: hypothetical protein QOJ68_2358 [Blastococcus sp.]|jgi:hypothetical protein|nr:hypothetical protein [Blastococcus sp.]